MEVKSYLVRLKIVASFKVGQVFDLNEKRTMMESYSSIIRWHLDLNDN